MGQGWGYFLEILGHFFGGECGGEGSAGAWPLVSGRGVSGSCGAGARVSAGWGA